jgi:hypothetical protein
VVRCLGDRTGIYSQGLCRRKEVVAVASGRSHVLEATEASTEDLGPLRDPSLGTCRRGPAALS